MKLKLIGLLAFVLIVGCQSERMRQKNRFYGGDPALATQQSVDELKTLINERFGRLEKRVHEQ